MARLRAVVTTQAPGVSGQTLRGQRSSAVANALLHRVLCELEIAEDACEDADGASHSSRKTRSTSSCMPSLLQNRRISMAPVPEAAGISAASRIA